MAESNGNTILGGTVESNSHGGIHIATTCERNTWLNMHNELNGSGPDWKIEGNYNILIVCAGVATAASLATAANIINGDYNQLISGVYDAMEIGSGPSNKIRRAPCRESVCKYVYIPVGVQSLKKKYNNK